MSAAKQVAAVVTMNSRAMRSRVAASLVVVVGTAVVVAVTLAIFSMSTGMMELIRITSPSPERMAIVSQGALDGGPSNISREVLSIIADTPGIKKAPDGSPLISGNVTAGYPIKRKGTGYDAFVTVSGAAQTLFFRRPEIKLVEGRMFTSGLRELIAGKMAVKQFQDVAIGKEILLTDGPWKIVGIFEGAGTTDLNLVGDSDTLMAVLRRTSFAVAFARLEEGTASAQDAFKTALKANPALSVDVMTEYEYRERGMRSSVQFYEFLAYGIAGIMGLGTIFAALNTMYAAVSARTIEIATLRAIGFGATPVVISIVIEALALAAIGAVIGTLFAWVAFNNREFSFGVMAIDQMITPTMIAAGIGISLLVGLIGALFPAIRAGRLPVTNALQVR